jgi:kumamolisin
MADQTPEQRVKLSGSDRFRPEGANVVGPVDPNERIEVSVYLRAPAGSNLDQEIAQRISQGQEPMTREEFAAKYSASVDDIMKVEQFAIAHQLMVVQANAARRVVILSGTLSDISAAFGVQLQRYEYQGNTFRGRTDGIFIPAELDGVVTGIFGIDNRPQARAHVKISAAPALSYYPPQLAQLYDFPTTGNGAGQTIGIIELGGGYNESDLTTYFGQLGLAVPNVVSVSVDGAQNAPTTANSADGEVALDIEVAGGVAPGANIAVYFAPNTDAGFLDAITTAVHDTANHPSVISISWGQAEASWTSQAMQNMDQAFQAAAAMGVTVCVAAGDTGSSDGVSDGLAHVDFPASDPYVLGCGGTSLQGSNGTITSEVVWNDNPTTSATGGGVSDVFALPTWQANAHVPPSVNPGAHVGRGVPDVAGDADPNTGYNVQVDGQALVFGGTSAVAPLWAGLIALFNQHLGKPVGYLNPTFYQSVSEPVAFHNITSGNNGSYSAGPGWNACTGLGSPDGAKLLAALTPTSASQ